VVTKINIMKILLLFLLLSLTSVGQGLVKVNSSTYFINSNNLILEDMDIDIDGSLDANGTIKLINGNLTINGDFDPGTSQFVFTNVTNHDHYLSTSTSSNNTFYDLYVIGDISTSYDLHLLSDINITNELQIQSQKINLNGKGIDLGSTGHLYYEGAGQYLYDSDPDFGNGYIQATADILSSSTSNPGNLGLEITTHSNQMGSTTIKRYHRKTDIGSSLYGLNRIFDVNPTYNGEDYGGNLNVDLKFLYFDDILGSVGDITSLKIYRSGDNGLTWENKGGTIDIDNGFVTISGFNQFSQITLAPDNGALPIELGYFEGHESFSKNLLYWSTESEHNSNYFDIETSTDGNNWKYIGTHSAAGNSISKLEYSYLAPIEFFGINYYRLKQVDFDSKYKYYGPIFIDNTRTNKKITKWVNLLGQEVKCDSEGIIFEIYEDGTSIKTIKY